MECRSCFVFISALVLCLFSTEICCNAIDMAIRPESSISTLQNEILISCVSNVDGTDRDITMMEIVRNDQPPIVFLRDCMNVSYGADAASRFQGEGRIDKDGGVLNVTLLWPRSEDTGIYTCVTYQVDKKGILHEERRSKTLTVEKLDISSLETVLNTMKERMLTSERNTRKEIDEIKENIGYVSAFSVTNKNAEIKTTAGKVMIFPDVIMRRGEGYDVATGVFTAPRDGLYAFHVVILQLNCGFHLDLMANDKGLGRLYSFNQGAWAPSSISSVTELKTGDRVYTKMLDSNCRLHKDYQYNIFSGYLINNYM